MNFNVTLKRKTSEGDITVLNFAPMDNTVCDCDSIIVKVPITAQGYLVDKVYTVSIAEYVAEVIEEPVA